MAKTEGQSARARFLNGKWETLPTWQLAAMVPYYVVYFAGRELIRNRGTILTASLAFVTALSIVPLLSVAVSVLAAFNVLEKDGSNLEPYIQRLFPASASEIAAYLEQFATTSATELAGIGVLAFLVIGLFLFVAIERVFNIIWQSDRERSWLQKSFAFVVLMTFGPVLISASFAISSRAQFNLSQFGVDLSILERLLPFLLGFVLFTAMNHFLPTARVHWGSSLLAGAFSAFAFELGKWGFNLYVMEIILVPYSQVYGTLGLFPLFLVWLYVTWVIVLVGAELAYCSQNLRTLATIESAQQRSPSKARDQTFNPLIALELYAPIARAFKSGEGRVSEKDLLATTGYSEAVIRAVIAQLEAIGALDVVEDDAGDRRFLPAKQLDDIQLLPLVDTFFDFEQKPNSLAMAKLLQGYRAVTLEVLRAETALSLIPQDDQLGQKYSQMKPWDPLPRSTLAESSSSSWEERPAPEVRSEPSVDKATTPQPGLAHAKTAAAPRVESTPKAESAPKVSYETTRPVSKESPGAHNVTSRPSQTKRSGESTDGIRIHTQDILVEEIEEVESELGLPAAKPQADLPAAKSKADLPAAKSSGGLALPKKKKKEASIEIDIAGMWDDFEVDNYEEILAQASESELRRTEELESGDISELGNEKSFPPPMPKNSKK